MNQQTTSATSSNGESSLRDLFALTDEQILEIEPEAKTAVTCDPGPVTREEQLRGESQASSESAPIGIKQAAAAEKHVTDSQTTVNGSYTGHGTRSTEHAAEPPAWLAEAMNDPQRGGEAKELWNGIQQAKQETAAYRAAFATPEDARALKELYPGGVGEARAAAERSRVLDDIDRAYFGAAGGTPEQTSAVRAQLAQRMLREDPAAFREMVFAGLRALEEAGAQAGANVEARFSASSPTAESTATQTVSNSLSIQGGLKSAPTNAPAHAPAETRAAEHTAHLASYAAFEKAANEDLECSVGAAIERTLAQALPNASRVSNASGVGAPAAAGWPLQARLSAAIRQDVEAALKGDRQLGEQITQILSSRRFDNETRAQVVRLIGERAQQLVPVAARRVINDWTQTTLAAHRSNAARADATSARREVVPAVAQAVSPAPFSSGREEKNRGAMPRPTPGSRRVDYRKLSDDQILDL